MIATWTIGPFRSRLGRLVAPAAGVAAAVALANAPGVLVADEPTGELDSVTEARVLELISAAAARGTAVLVASHSPAVAATAQRVVRLDDGRVCE